MRTLNRIAALLAAVFLATPHTGTAADAKLTIGDAAPALDVAHWFTGEKQARDEQARFEDGQVYVVEFWATWCGPCIAAMPHVAELKEKHGDAVRIFSISDESVEKVEAFLERPYVDAEAQIEEKLEGDDAKEDKATDDAAETPPMTYGDLTSVYALATDPDESVYEDYMRAAGENGIPTAFIVGKTGLIEWIGHPMTIDSPLAKILADTWDRQQYVVVRAVRSDLMDLMPLVQRGVKLDVARERLDAIEKRVASLETAEDDLQGMLAFVRGTLTSQELLAEAIEGDAAAREGLFDAMKQNPQQAMTIVRGVMMTQQKLDETFTEELLSFLKDNAADNPSGMMMKLARMQLLQSPQIDRPDEAMEVVDELLNDPRAKQLHPALKQMKRAREQADEMKKRLKAMQETRTKDAEGERAEEKKAEK